MPGSSPVLTPEMIKALVLHGGISLQDVFAKLTPAEKRSAVSLFDDPEMEDQFEVLGGPIVPPMGRLATGAAQGMSRSGAGKSIADIAERVKGGIQATFRGGGRPKAIEFPPKTPTNLEKVSRSDFGKVGADKPMSGQRQSPLDDFDEVAKRNVMFGGVKNPVSKPNARVPISSKSTIGFSEGERRAMKLLEELEKLTGGAGTRSVLGKGTRKIARRTPK